MKKFKTIQLPLELDKTYNTKFQVAEPFTVKRIVYHPKETDKQIWVEGIYLNKPYLGLCPLNAERLIADTQEVLNEEFKEAWRQELKRYHKMREHMSEDEMTNSDFCDYVIDNFEFPIRVT